MYIQLFNRSLCVDLYSLCYVCTYNLSKETTTYVHTFENFRSWVIIFLRWPEVKRVIIIESIETTSLDDGRFRAIANREGLDFRRRPI